MRLPVVLLLFGRQRGSLIHWSCQSGSFQALKENSCTSVCKCYVREEREKETKLVCYFDERLMKKKKRKKVLVVADLHPVFGRKGESVRGEKYCFQNIGLEHHVPCKEYVMIKLSSTLCHSVEIFFSRTITF